MSLYGGDSDLSDACSPLYCGQSAPANAESFEMDRRLNKLAYGHRRYTHGQGVAHQRHHTREERVLVTCRFLKYHARSRLDVISHC